MGVPKFYRWISERYPCLSEVVKEYQIPEFDNLYLDMNGIIHVCSHPEDDNPHFRITEEKIMQDIFHYIEVLFRMIKPKKVFFMAVDGVAPRAKMNQQRGRRFRSAREAEDLAKKAIEKGETLPNEARFDSNCITPGTEFMVRLHEQLKYFVVKKVSTDTLWQGVRIILSGHETPGEGEHKIMDFIRYEKSQPDYDANTRHCLYGLDADLIMLGLSSHEPHFSLLREEVKFGKKAQKRISTVEETTFHLLHISLMREYIDYEFASLKDKLPFGYDLEKIIDDWVLMGFLVGNDFIPHLPDMHIHHNALPLLWKTYKKVLPTLNGYLNNGGDLNLENFEKYLRVLSKVDFENFTERHADMKWLESRSECRHANKHHALSSDEAGIPTADEFMQHKNDNDVEDEDFSAFQKQDFDEMMAQFDSSEEEDDDIDEDDDPNTYDEQFFTDFRHFKADYYRDKLELQNINQDVLKEQALGYVKAIQWILLYYFKGVPSWSWYYPHHYAPYLSDVRDFSDIKIEFDLNKPFLPFQQLMAVLPAASKNLMPVPLQSLMLSENSPVIDYYPEDFKTDLNGKQQQWEAVVLIPFIDENRLISAMAPLEEKLTDEEKSRNKHGPHVMFEYTPESLGTYTSSMFPDIIHHHAKITYLPLDKFWMKDKSKLRQGLCPGIKLDVYFPGFPTMKHIPHTAKLERGGVRVFQHVSKGENMMLTITKTNEKTLEQLARDMIGQSIYVAWPHLSEAQVTAVSDGQTKFYWLKDKFRSADGKAKIHIESLKLNDGEAGAWMKDVCKITEEYRYRKGVIVGNTEVLVYANPLAGLRYICSRKGDVVLEKQWSTSSQPFVLQTTVKNLSVSDPKFKQYDSLADLFSPKSEVFMLGHPEYGCMGKVIDVDVTNVRIRIDFTVLQEPDLSIVQTQTQQFSTQYFPGYLLARRLGLSNLMLSRITGCVFMIKSSPNTEKKAEHSDRMNVGLDLKLNKSNQEVPGYTKKAENEWLYSDALEKIVHDYTVKFPELFDYMSQNTCESSYYAEHIFGKDNYKNKIQELSTFLKELPCSKVQRVPQGSEVLDEMVIKEIERLVNEVQEVNKKKKKHKKMQVRPHLLFRPLEAQLTLVPDPSTTYRLFDRIVNVRDGFSVPLGLRGTVIGITNAEKERDILYDVVFDEPFLGGLTLRCSPNRGYRMPTTAMINLSHGERKRSGNVVPANKPTAVVKPQSTHNSYVETAGYIAGKQNYQPQIKSRNVYSSNRMHGFSDLKLQNSYEENRQQLRCQNQSSHSGQNKLSEDKPAEDEFTNLWQQLQNKPYTSSEQNKNGETAAGSGKKTKAVEQRPAPSTLTQPNLDGSTLQKAANVLKTSLQQEPKMVSMRNPKQKDQEQGRAPTAQQRIDIQTLLASDGEHVKFSPSQRQLKEQAKIKQQQPSDDQNEFSAILQSLQGNAQTQPAVQTDTHESTAVLRQILNIDPESSGKHAQCDTAASGKPKDVNITVHQLFQGAEQHKQPQGQGQGRNQGRGNKRTTVDMLLEWCQSVGMPPPEYNYQQSKDNKQRAIVKLASGHSFHGEYLQSQAQAAENVAGIALNRMTGPQGGLQRFGLPQGPLQPRYGPKHLSTSPNSAFTPVRSPAQGMLTNQHQPFGSWMLRGSANFPPAPAFGFMSQHDQIALQHQGRVKGQSVPGQFRLSGHSQGQMGMKQPPPPHWPQQHYQHRQPAPQQQQQNWPQQEQHSQPHQPNWPHHQGQHGWTQQQQQQHQMQTWSQWDGRGHGSKVGQQGRMVRDHGAMDGSQSTASQPENANKGASAFIPLQVMQKQKTPQQKSSKESSGSQPAGDGSEDGNKSLLPSDGEHIESTPSTEPLPSERQPTSSEQERTEAKSQRKHAEQNSNSTSSQAVSHEEQPNRCEMTHDKTKEHRKDGVASSSSSNRSSKNPTAVTPQQGPNRRPKSRLAAKFPVTN